MNKKHFLKFALIVLLVSTGSIAHENSIFADSDTKLPQKVDQTVPASTMRGPGIGEW